MSEIKYPKGERTWVSYWSRENELLFLLTSKENNCDWYYLYENVDGVLKKLGKARTPPELEQKYNVNEKVLSGGKNSVKPKNKNARRIGQKEKDV